MGLIETNSVSSAPAQNEPGPQPGGAVARGKAEKLKATAQKLLQRMTRNDQEIIRYETHAGQFLSEFFEDSDALNEYNRDDDYGEDLRSQSGSKSWAKNTESSMNSSTEDFETCCKEIGKKFTLVISDYSRALRCLKTASELLDEPAQYLDENFQSTTFMSSYDWLTEDNLALFHRDPASACRELAVFLNKSASERDQDIRPSVIRRGHLSDSHQVNDEDDQSVSSTDTQSMDGRNEAVVGTMTAFELVAVRCPSIADDCDVLTLLLTIQLQRRLGHYFMAHAESLRDAPSASGLQPVPLDRSTSSTGPGHVAGPSRVTVPGPTTSSSSSV